MGETSPILCDATEHHYESVTVSESDTFSAEGRKVRTDREIIALCVKCANTVKIATIPVVAAASAN